MFARAGTWLTTIARHAVPFGGLLGREWHPVVALGVYWFESLLLVLVAAGLSALIHRRASPAALADARQSDDAAGMRAIAEEQRALTIASIRPSDVLIFHLGSLFVIGGFLAGVMIILIGNGRIDRPVDWLELRDGALAMLLVVAVAFAIDLWRFDRLTVTEARERVDACMSRWGLFWLLCFFGTILMAFTERPTIFFTFFAGLKVVFESWARLARLFGWRSIATEASAPRQA